MRKNQSLVLRFLLSSFLGTEFMQVLVLKQTNQTGGGEKRKSHLMKVIQFIL